MPNKSATHAGEKISTGVRKPPQSARASRHQAPQVNPTDAIARAQALPASELSASDILTLQRTAGNRAVEQLLAQQLHAEKTSAPRRRSLIIQAKLAVGPTNDTYEREADRVAATVMQTRESSPAHIQRSLSQVEDQDEIVQAKPLASSITPLIQRQEMTEEEEEDSDDVIVQRCSAGGLTSIGPEIESGIEQARGNGEALPGEVRARMEPAFGADFSGVRVHADSKADTLNRSLRSRAFTTGQHLFFRRGEYNPDSQRGRELLAHELTHVVQQAGATTSQATLHNKVSITPSPSDNVQRQPMPYQENDDYQFGMDPEVYYGRPGMQYVPDYDPIDDPDVPQGPGRLSRMGSAIASGARSLGAGIASGARWAGGKIASGARWAGGKIASGASWVRGGFTSGTGWLARNARDAGSWLGSKFRGQHWGGSSPDQQVQHVGSRMGLASGVATAGGGIGTLISTGAVHGADERVLDPMLQQADLALRREGGPQTFSQVGQGFSSASGIASGLQGLVSMGSGLQNIGAEKRLSGRWLRRGIGRTTTGAGQVFAGMAAAGKGISAMTGATTAGAQFMTAAALPASIAMGSVDVLKGGWGTYKAYKSRQALERKQEEFAFRKYQVNHPGSQSPSLPKMADFAGFAREYQGKRMGRKVAGMVSGALGVAGGAMMLTGVGLLPGAIVAGLGGLIKVGAGLFGALRDKIAGEECAKAKKQKEQEMAQFAAEMLGSSAHGKDMEEMLSSIGMEEKTIAAIKTMAPELRKPFILAQLMRR
jgi:hypothetical protein